MYMNRKYKIGNGQTVSIDDDEFDTIKEAAEFLEMSPAELGNILYDNEVHKIKGFNVRRVSKKSHKINGRIYCYNKGWIFKNAASLARMLHLNPNFVANKLKNEGKYVDIYGNVYRRVQNEENFTSQYYREVDKRNTTIRDLMKPEVKVQPVVETKPEVEEVEEPEPIVEVKTVSEEKKEETVVNNNELETLKNVVVTLLDKGDYEASQAILDVMARLTKKA